MVTGDKGSNATSRSGNLIKLGSLLVGLVLPLLLLLL